MMLSIMYAATDLRMEFLIHKIFESYKDKF